MAVVQINSNILAPVYSTPLAYANQDYLDGAEILRKSSVVTTANADTIASQYRICQVSSSDFPMDITYLSTAFGTGAAMNLGLYQTNSTTALNATLFASALSMVAATTAPVSIRFVTLGALTGAQRVWELLGLTKDPGLVYDLCWTLSAAGTSGGTISTFYNYSK